MGAVRRVRHRPRAHAWPPGGARPDDGRARLPPISEEELAAIRVPTTLVWGRHALATPIAIAERARDRFGWALEMIEDCGADLPVERPEEFLAVLRPLIARAAPPALDELRTRLNGRLLSPGDARFAEATRLWNGMIERTPAVAIQPLETGDVVAAVEFAREHGLPLGVRGGGHNIGGTAPEGVTIDMSALREIQVDPAHGPPRWSRAACFRTSTARRSAMAWRRRSASSRGRGRRADARRGLGYLTRRFGWTVDNLLEVEIVTADGSVRQAAATRTISSGRSAAPVRTWAWSPRSSSGCMRSGRPSTAG